MFNLVAHSFVESNFELVVPKYFLLVLYSKITLGKHKEWKEWELLILTFDMLILGHLNLPIL